MNRTKIEWADYTWNPVTGCLNDCPYCYARRIYHRFGRSFEPKFYPERLEEPTRVKKPSKIFVCSVADLFGEWVPGVWIEQVNDIMEECRHHTFFLLTKNPARYDKMLYHLRYPSNVWCGTTVTWTGDFPKGRVPGAKTYLSFEPLLGPVDFSFVNVGSWDWFIVGAQTGPGAIKPDPGWVEAIIDVADKTNTPVFLKDNLNWPEKRQEFPGDREEG